MQKFDKANLKKIRIALEGALDGMVDDLGMPIKLKLGGISYSEANFTVKLECSLINGDGVVQNKERMAWLRLASSYDLDPEWIDQTFKTHDGKVLKITGLNTRARKAPVLLEDVEGNMYKGPCEMIRDHMTS
tara:strand:+ start:3029 stop:3424 length:396 start_codon:yes stop_codon:yes gene_type:complete